MIQTIVPPLPHLEQQRMLTTLEQKTFFKLIAGGSLTDVAAIQSLVSIYLQSGMDCIDLAPDLAVIEAVNQLVASVPDENRPVLMVSLPLDPDPHFRKIELLEPDCILCGACVPICPTGAIELEPTALNITQSLCYGCGRCPEVCPTDALVLHPFLNPENTQAVLSHPAVGAVEIHTRYADPLMLAEFLEQYQSVLNDKLLSICFRPDQIEIEQWIGCLQKLLQATSTPVIFQVDGQPMSGSDDPNASLPSLAAARFAYQKILEFRLPTERLLLTISGGINAKIADYLKSPEYDFICGVGMGSFAKSLVWPFLQDVSPASASARLEANLKTPLDQASQMAKELLSSFKGS